MNNTLPLGHYKGKSFDNVYRFYPEYFDYVLKQKRPRQPMLKFIDYLQKLIFLKNLSFLHNTTYIYHDDFG